MSHFEGKPKKAKDYSAKLDTVAKIQDNCTIKAIPERRLNLETCKHFGILTEMDQTSGQAITHYFPITKEGDTVGYVARALNRPKKQAWYTVGDVEIDCDLFGTQSCENGRKVLYVTEGMYDAPALWQAMKTDPKNKTNQAPNVVSINLGTKNALENMDKNRKFLERHGIVATCFDNDECTAEELKKQIMKGKEATAKVQIYFQSIWKNENTSIEYVPIEDYKDACDYLKAGKAHDLFILAAFGRKVYEPESILSGGGDLEEINTPIGKGTQLQCFDKTMHLLHGLRPGELTILLAPVKCGKTSICKEVNYHLLKAGIPTLGAYLEEDAKKTRQSFIARDNLVHLPKFREDPSIVKDEDKLRTLQTVLHPSIAMFADNSKGHIGPKQCMQMFEYAYAKGAKFIILDHLSYVFSGSAGDNERKEIDNLLTEMAAFVRRTGVHVICVSHIKRKLLNPPRDKEGNVKYPYWIETEEQDARGSGAFEQLCFNMLAIDKQVLESKQRGHTRLKVLYNREWDWTGIGDVITMNPTTGVLETVDEQEMMMGEEYDE